MIIKRKPGRPQKFNTQELSAIHDAFNEYIDGNDDPTIARFIAAHNWSLTKDYISSRPEFSDLVTKAILKQEGFLLTQYKNPAMAIFRLKQPQHGYTDKREVESKSLNVDVQVAPELAQGFMAYLKQSTSVKDN